MFSHPGNLNDARQLEDKHFNFMESFYAPIHLPKVKYFTVPLDDGMGESAADTMASVTVITPATLALIHSYKQNYPVKRFVAFIS